MFEDGQHCLIVVPLGPLPTPLAFVRHQIVRNRNPLDVAGRLSPRIQLAYFGVQIFECHLDRLGCVACHIFYEVPRSIVGIHPHLIHLRPNIPHPQRMQRFRLHPRITHPSLQLVGNLLIERPQQNFALRRILQRLKDGGGLAGTCPCSDQHMPWRTPERLKNRTLLQAPFSIG